MSKPKEKIHRVFGSEEALRILIQHLGVDLKENRSFNASWIINNSDARKNQIEIIEVTDLEDNA